MPTATVRIIKGALAETELAALVTVLHVLGHSTPGPTPGLRPGLTTYPRRAPWTRPRRRSGPAWLAALAS
jgi:hypothetical protein